MGRSRLIAYTKRGVTGLTGRRTGWVGDGVMGGDLDVGLLDTHANRSYGALPVPSGPDDAIGHLVRSYMALPAADKVALIADLTQEQTIRQTPLLHRESLHTLVLMRAQVLEEYSIRMAELAVRQHDPAPLLPGLVALTLAATAETDLREVWARLPLAYRSAQKVGADPRQVFAQAAEGALPEGQELLRSFFNRTEENRQIEVMWYEESADATGFRYAFRPHY